MDTKNPIPSAIDMRVWHDLTTYQLRIARRWLKRGDKTADVFCKFFFYFSGFNAVYFLWRKIDNLDNRNETVHIKNLLGKLNGERAREILDRVKTNIEYFCERRPIQRMDRRSMDSQKTGDRSEGEGWKQRLRDTELPSSEHVVALGEILYLVRSNLVHGSKRAEGDDLEIIQMSVEPLRILLEETIHRTERELPSEG